MKLHKSKNALQNRIIDKFSINCDQDKDKYLHLISILYKSLNENAVVISGLYDNRIDIVLKVGLSNSINKEYEIAKKIQEQPNFIRYFCKFVCEDNIKKIIKQQNMINTYNLCKSGNEEIGILVMNYYNVGSIGNYNWNTENFNVLKNVLKQCVYAYLFAYSKFGFVHGDFHSDNILLKKKNKYEIDYFYKVLIIDTFEIRIMDFEKSKINDTLEFKCVLNDIEKLFDSVKNDDRRNIKLNYKNEKLRKMKNTSSIDNIKKSSINQTHFEIMDSIIDSFYIEI
jgi:hypothetical protein